MELKDIDILADSIAKKINIQPRWLKLTAAAKYSSIGKDRLKSLADARLIIGYQEPDSRGDWIFDRESIDNYRLSIVCKNKKKALSILKSL